VEPVGQGRPPTTQVTLRGSPCGRETAGRMREKRKRREKSGSMIEACIAL
jgi:hypothetical protein